jgi:hypothetical protein
MTDLRLTPEQADLLRQVLQQAERAVEARSLVFSAIVRGHGLTDARLVALTDRTLTVEPTPDA